MELSNSTIENIDLQYCVHGRGCQRGELMLTEAELDLIRPHIASLGFTFAPLPKTKGKPESPSWTEARGAAGVGKSALIAFEDRLADERKNKTEGLRSRTRAKKDSSESSESSDEEIGDTRKRRRKSTPSVPPPLRSRQSRRRREVQTGRWEESCAALLDILESQPESKWFLQPVDPEADGVPDYLDTITTPMDMQTIRQKLDKGMYSHPYRWQADVRLVFFNAFEFHPGGNRVSKDAVRLAKKFENLCKEHEGVNPYALYAASAPTVPSSGEAITLNPEQLREIITRAASNTPIAERPNWPPQSNIPPEIFAAREDPPLTPNSSSDSSESSMDDVPNSAAGLTPTANSIASSIPPGTRHPEDFRDEFGGVYYPASFPWEHDFPVSQLNPPPDPPVAPLPGKLSDKPTNQIQRRTIVSKLRQLDVTYRLAALEMVKDELGINAYPCALDARYTPELEVLPVMKQKLLLAYIKTLVAYQKEQTDRHIPPTLANPLGPTEFFSPPPTAQEPPPPTPEQPLPTHQAHAEADAIMSSSSSNDSDDDPEIGSDPVESFPQGGGFGFLADPPENGHVSPAEGAGSGAGKESSWGEWKSKVIHASFITPDETQGNETNVRAAEQANAEI